MKDQDILFLLEELHTMLLRQYDKMADMRLMYNDIKNIQDLHWSVLYLGNMVKMQQLIEQGIKELKAEKGDKMDRDVNTALKQFRDKYWNICLIKAEYDKQEAYKLYITLPDWCEDFKK